MMKKYLILLLFVLLTSNFVSAISSDLRETYQPGETMIIELSGNILENIPTENVEFRRAHVKVPFDYDIKKIEGRYYLWATAIPIEGNYTLVINNIVTTVVGNIQKVNYEKNFTVKGNFIDYSVKPGLISTKEDFELNIMLNEDTDKVINLNFPVDQNIVIKPGENKLKFSIVNVTSTRFIKIKVGKYTLPVYIIANKTVVITPSLKLVPDYIQRSTSGKEALSYQIIIQNTGNNKVKDISIFYNKELFSTDLKATEGIIIERNDSLRFNLIVKETGKEIKEKIYVNTPSLSIDLPVEIKITENATQIQNASKGVLYYCSEISGTICSANEACTGKTETSIDGLCCIGKCSSKEEEPSRTWIGYLLLAIVLGILGYLYMRYKKAKPKKSLIEEAKESKKKFP